MGAVIYCRVSSQKQQTRNEANLPTQQKRCEDWASNQKIPVLAVFTGEGESAWSTTRPTLEEAFDYIRQSKGKVTHFIVQDTSRFSRNVESNAIYNARLRKLGVKLVSVDEPMLDESPVGQLTATILSGIAQFYSHSLSSRVRYRFQVNREKGRWLHQAPVGYRNENKELLPDEKEAPLVRQTFEMVASGFYSSDRVREMIHAAGLRTKKGNKFSKQSFSWMLKNPLYCGIIRHNGQDYTGTFQPVVSVELWQRVQDVLAGKKKSVPKKPTNEQWPLRGFVLCGTCGAKLTAGNVKGRTKTYAKYWCWAEGCPSPLSVSKEQLEFDWIALLDLLQPTGDMLVNAVPKMVEAKFQNRLHRIEQEQRRLTGRLSERKALKLTLIEAKLKGELSQSDFEEKRDSIAQEIEDIEKSQRELSNETATMQQLTSDTERQAVDLAATWKNAALAERQEVQSALFPDGILYSHEKRFFEPGNVTLQELVDKGMEQLSSQWDFAKVLDGRDDWI